MNFAILYIFANVDVLLLLDNYSIKLKLSYENKMEYYFDGQAYNIETFILHISRIGNDAKYVR